MLVLAASIITPVQMKDVLALCVSISNPAKTKEVLALATSFITRAQMDAFAAKIQGEKRALTPAERQLVLTWQQQQAAGAAKTNGVGALRAAATPAQT